MDKHLMAPARNLISGGGLKTFETEQECLLIEGRSIRRIDILIYSIFFAVPLTFIPWPWHTNWPRYSDDEPAQ